ncbi:Gfo/Idh/MocA family oxidoreductase [Rathayibacter oskolensis]|uniref:Gfo/Idh/MocA family protein n=1 Tax=Rathayibacter oskolensis TaxID=1891671 RepID=UPI00265E22DF|nr:Gfo/Idh/MocA family oxidoreductase [Rathayibacter oskolensis]WKK71585.1 Gfo/Idh/MocA family oxidoreductase [Rathayibacter oskolensis]
MHRAQAEAVLGAGVAVIIDKPFAPTAADAIIAASEAAGAPVFVFQNRRWDADLLTLRRLLADGALGDVVRFESSFERWSAPKTGRWQTRVTPAEGGGILFDLGSHLVDQALVLFGPAQVTAAETRIVHTGGASEDDAFVSLLHAGECGRTSR